jgi:probable phosphoglycerate mutase
VTARLLLVRHGVTDWNREGRFQGHLDPPLADDGRRQAILLGERLAQLGPRPSRVVSSTLGRALQTARLVAAALSDTGPRPALVTDSRLMEIGQGDWEGRTHRELAVAEPEHYEAWRRSEVPPPNAEPIEDARRRIAGLLAELAGELEGCPEATLCLVSHGGILRLAAGELLGLSLAQTWLLDVDNASLASLTRGADGGWQLERWNDVGHLLGRMTTHTDESEGEPLAL